MESPDFTDPIYGVPVFSLYGEVRRPTGQSMGTFDTILVDLQDLGCRIYTYVTTLLYVLEAAAQHGKSVWVLDRPNPAGRPVEGLTLRSGLGELRRCGTDADAAWHHARRAWPLVRHHFELGVHYRVIEMEAGSPTKGRASAGRPSVSGSTQARTPPISTWHGPTPAL